MMPDQHQDDHSSIHANTKAGEVSIVSHGLILVIVSCVVATVWISTKTEHGDYYPYLVLLAIAGLAMSSFYSLRLAQLSTETARQAMERVETLQIATLDLQVKMREMDEKEQGVSRSIPSEGESDVGTLHG